MNVLISALSGERAGAFRFKAEVLGQPDRWEAGHTEEDAFLRLMESLEIPVFRDMLPDFTVGHVHVPDNHDVVRHCEEV